MLLFQSVMIRLLLNLLLGFNDRCQDQADYLSLCPLSILHGAALTISQQAGKMHRPFPCFSNQTNKKCYILGATVLNLSYYTIFPFTICDAVPVCYDKTFVEFTAWFQ